MIDMRANKTNSDADDYKVLIVGIILAIFIFWGSEGWKEHHLNQKSINEIPQSVDEKEKT